MEEHESAEGNFNGHPIPQEPIEEPIKTPQPLPVEKTKKEIIKEYEEEAKPALKEYGRRIVKQNYFDLMKYGLIIMAIFVVVFGYMAFQGKFQTEVICPTPNITIPSCPAAPACPACPELSCPANNINFSCGDTYFPDSLSVQLENNSND